MHQEDAPLKGIRVLEVFGQYPGPYCAMLMGDLGAEVIKVELPKTGDPVRQFPGFFLSINRNKKSLTLDLRTKTGREIFYKLAEKSDVILEGFRPGVAKRLGIDYEAIRVVNPRIVYCSISGFGQDGPYVKLAGHDLNYVGMSGMLGVTGTPFKPTIQIADLASGLFALGSALSALILREKTGEGQYIDLSMLDVLMSLMSTHVGTCFAQKDKPYRGGHLDSNPAYEIYETKDGKYITLGIAHEDEFWRSLCKVLGMDDIADLTNVERIETREAVYSRLRQAFSTKTRHEWVELLHNADVPCAPVYTMEEAVRDPAIMQRGAIMEIEHPIQGKIAHVRFPAKFSKIKMTLKPPPLVGQHTDEILQSLGYTEEEIREFRDAGVI